MPRYNILMVLADQHNASQFSGLGHPQVLTPHFDRFAQTGVQFTNAYTQNTICTPSRISILTGQYCHNHGYYGLTGPTKPGMDNFMRQCKKAGYRTAAYGKLHLPNDPEHWLKHDLDEFGDAYETADGDIGVSKYFSYLEKLGLRKYDDSWHNTRYYHEAKSISKDAMPSALPYEHTLEVWCAQQAMDFIQRDRGRPFCIQIAFLLLTA
jgi:arylsulfatase